MSTSSSCELVRRAWKHAERSGITGMYTVKTSRKVRLGFYDV